MLRLLQCLLGFYTIVLIISCASPSDRAEDLSQSSPTPYKHGAASTASTMIAPISHHL